MGVDDWAALQARQLGMIARRQLRQVGIDWHRTRNQLRAERWAARTSRVISTFTGPLTPEHRMWLGVLHAGGESLVGGLTAGAAHGLRHWDRDEVTVLVDDERMFDPVPGIRFVRTRRSLALLRDPTSPLPLCRLEPAVLLFAAYTRSRSAAHGVLAATVQQRLTTPAQLRRWLDRMRPLRRSGEFRRLIEEMAEGAQSWGEARFGRLCRQFGVTPPHRQTLRREASGQPRYTDCEWDVPGGTVVLEIDGPFHMEVAHWASDIARQRALTGPGRTIVRCTTRELDESPEQVMADLRRLGVPGDRPHRQSRAG